MGNREKLKKYIIKCQTKDLKIISATISLWIEKMDNPVVVDLVDEKTYNLQGKYNIFFMEYRDVEERVLQNQSDRLSNAFYGLRKKTESNNLKLLIKGSNLNYYMIPRLQYSVKAIELTLNERITENADKVIIFDSEDDISKIVSVENQFNFYKKWAESIKGLPYK